MPDLLDLPVDAIKRVAMVKSGEDPDKEFRTDKCGPKTSLWFTLRSIGHHGLRCAADLATRDVLRDTLHNAIAMNDGAWTAQLLGTAGLAKHVNLERLLRVAACQGSVDAASAILAAGGRLDAFYRYTPDDPVHAAVVNKALAVVRLFLGRGAVVGDLPETLKYAVRWGNVEVVKLLLATHDGVLPQSWLVGWLNHAIAFGNPEIVAALLDAGARVPPFTLQKAWLYNNDSVIALLTDAPEE